MNRETIEAELVALRETALNHVYLVVTVALAAAIFACVVAINLRGFAP